MLCNQGSRLGYNSGKCHFLWCSPGLGWPSPMPRKAILEFMRTIHGLGLGFRGFSVSKDSTGADKFYTRSLSDLPQGL